MLNPGTRVIDTNVPLVVKFRADSPGELVDACEDIIMKIMTEELPVVTDLAGEIIEEYFHKMSHAENSLADLFAKYVHDFRWQWGEKYMPDIEPDGVAENSYGVLGGDDVQIDPSDRKFVAVAKVSGASIVQARDTKWLDWKEILTRHNVKVEYAHEQSLRTMYKEKFGREAP
ncbi:MULTISPECIES: hypothetical protein [Kocuria]|nr:MULTISPECIES: hypothetical protein [Kocuria]MCT1545380.1 hypothetical protein [Kocuria rhizophila]MDN3461211.1 hypothetical protein [Kocuria sp. APC 4018]